MHISRSLFLFCSFLVLLVNPKNMRLLRLSSSSETRSFEFNSLPYGYLTFFGDSHLHLNEIALTKEGPINSPRSAGVVLYSHPILFPDPHSKKVPSFSTMFAFYIDNTHGDEGAFGDGLAFLISPDNNFIGSPGYLGLVDSPDPNRKKFIAIEFDTRRDPMFHDPDDNHVGLDINSLFSVKLATSSSLGVNLKSGALIRTWIDYKSNVKRLEVFLSDSYLKPNKPLLKVDIDLSDYLKGNMFVGFSAATETGMQLTRIEQWKFTILELSPPPPPPSSLEPGRPFPIPPESGHRHTHLSRFAIGLALGLCSIPFIVLFGLFSWKKLTGIIQRSERRNNLEMQTIRSSAESACELYILVEVARCLYIEKVIENEAELNCVKAVNPKMPFCNNLPALKHSGLPHCISLPYRTNDMTSGQ